MKTLSVYVLSILFWIFNSIQVKALDGEVSGLVLDRSITLQGKDFYRNFSLLWYEVQGMESYNLIIKETILPQYRSLLTVETNGTQLYQIAMSPRQTRQEPKVQEAVQISLQQMRLMNQHVDSRDLISSGY